MQPLKIIVDNRERNLEILGALSESGVEIDFVQLPVGDYIISDRMCVERKTVSDFESSIIDNRLFEQMDRLRASFDKPIMIIEGADEDHRLQSNVILGAILRLYTDHNVQILKSSDALETAAMLSKFAEREQTDDKRVPRIMGVKKAYNSRQWQLLILNSVPGVGPKLANKLLAHFKTIRNVASADVDELKKVDKVGKKKAERIYAIMNGEFGVDDA